MMQTTLAQGAPWPKSYLKPVIQTRTNSSRIGMIYKKREKPTIQPPRATVNTQVLQQLRQHIESNPGQSMTKIRTSMHWNQSKTERYITELRSELGNGYFLKSSLKDMP
jgi:hypothetical protein